MPRRLLLAVVAAGTSLTSACAGGTQPVAGPASSPTPTVAAEPSPSPASPAAKSRPRNTREQHRYAFPLRCTASYGRTHHDYPATDVFAARGCPFVAPTAGRVDEVGRTDDWDPATNNGAQRSGRFVAVVGDDGVRYYGSHLDRVASAIRPGVRVRRGTVLGYVGNSGNARGIATHLHFGLSWPTRAGVWWVRRGMVYPWPYLDAWRAGRHRSPAAAVRTEHRRQGDVPPCRAGC